MFCSKCGTKNDDSSNFCVKCGNPLRQVSIKEKNLLFIPKASIGKFVGTGVYRQFYNLLITDRRIIAGRTGMELIRSVSRALQDGKKYSDLEPEQILQVDKRNFAFYFSDLKNLELKKMLIGGSGRITLSSRSGDTKRIFFDKKYYREVERVLKQVAGNVLI
jgi:hypothetical protein